MFGDIEPYRIPSLVSGVAMGILAAWIFALGPGSRLHRAFGLFLALLAARSLLLAWDGSVLSDAGRLTAYVAIALPFATVHLANQAWLLRGHPSRASLLRSSWVSWGLFAAGASLEIAYLADHSLYASPGGPFGVELGRLFYVHDVQVATFALVTLALALAFAGEASPLRRTAIFDVALASAMPATFQATHFALYAGAFGVDGAAATVYAIAFALLALAAIGAFVLSRRSGASPRAAVSLLLGMALAAASAVGVRATSSAPWGIEFLMSVQSGWTLFMVGLIGLAILRHRFLDLDVQVRKTVGQGVVASMFVATYFVIGEAAQQLFGDHLPGRNARYIGIAAAGLLMFALSPLQRWGAKVAAAAMPEAVAMEERTLDEKVAVFAEQTRIAWEDGVLTAKERRMLEHARERLGLSEAQAARIERRVLEDFHPVRRGRPAAAAGSAKLDPWAVRD